MKLTRAHKVTSIGAAIALIIAGVVAVEGGFTNNPSDPGGPTMYGVTQAVARAHGYTGPMQALSKTQAEKIYREQYVEDPGFVPIIEASPAVGHKLVDAGVNVGPARASRWFQLALNALNRGGKDYADVDVDGDVGLSTLAAYRSLEHVRGRVKACELVLKLLDAQQAAYYMSLGRMEQFTPGWVDNRVGNVPLSDCANEVTQ